MSYLQIHVNGTENTSELEGLKELGLENDSVLELPLELNRQTHFHADGLHENGHDFRGGRGSVRGGHDGHGDVHFLRRNSVDNHRGVVYQFERLHVEYATA